jgi:hypothetical protein
MNESKVLLTEDEIYELLKELPPIPLDDTLLKGTIIDVDKYINENRVQEVTSYYIHEPGTNNFHPEGLFSEEIFGKMISTDRFSKMGYINLNTELIQPAIYFILKSLKSLYINILEGKVYAKFNNEIKDFELTDRDDPKGNTGYLFFINHIYKLKPPKVQSPVKSGYREVFLKYQSKKTLTMNKLLVLPAGLREISEDTKKLARDTINQMYLNVLSLSKSIDPKVANDIIYDNIKVMIQNKIMDIWNYIINIISGDKGYIQDKFGDRNIAFGTGNVLSIDIKQASSPDDPANLKHNEVGLSLLQVTKAYQPQCIYYLKNFFKNYINEASGMANLIDGKSLQRTSVYLSSKKVKLFTDDQYIESFINSLQYDIFKLSPVSVKIKNNEYYFNLIYDLDKIVMITPNVPSLKTFLESKNIKFDKSKLRPQTWLELFYFILYATVEKGLFDNEENFGMTTRYPAIQPESIRPLKPKIYTTIPYRTVVYYRDISENTSPIILPQYPILKAKTFESIVVNALTMSQYGADTDGDTLSFTAVYSKDSKKELGLYYKTSNSLLTEDGNFQFIEKDTHELVIKALSLE